MEVYLRGELIRRWRLIQGLTVTLLAGCVIHYKRSILKTKKVELSVTGKLDVKILLEIHSSIRLKNGKLLPDSSPWLACLDLLL